MSKNIGILCCSMGLVLGSCAAITGRPSAGGEVALSDAEKSAVTRIGGKVTGLIVWSSSRHGNHDLFVMNTDGSGMRQLTKGDAVDWFSRFSPDGKRVMFTRSKKGWVAERDSNRNRLWDIYTVNLEGSDEKLVAKDASWGTWIGENQILFSRDTQVFKKDLQTEQETLILDGQQEAALGGAELQQPQLSPDGRFLAITLRGAKRETGIFDLEKKTWVRTGEGCQINWHPAGGRIYWDNPSGNGGSEVFSVEVREGKPVKDFSYEEMRWIDIPGRRSHEYFPQMSRDGKWLVWGATQRGHDHDIADYEIYIWQIGAPAEEATRLTFHSGNDRWPDIFLPLGNQGR